VSFDPTQPRNSDGKWSSSIIDSIEHQMKLKGHGQAKAHDLAIEIGQNHGLIDKQGRLTALGREREALGHKGRVIDRAAQQLGRKPEELNYQRGRAFVKYPGR
jgi:hypothetical protein